MGCCNSTTSSPYGSPPPTSTVSANNHDSSRAAINQPARSLNSERDSSELPPPTTRPNQPIRPPSPLPTSPSHIPNRPPPWTRSQLEREREAFFDTRVSGNSEIWKALRVVSEEVRAGNVSEAQAILDALGATCPTGKIARGSRKNGGGGRSGSKGGLYDERGEMYDIPPWVVVDPEDVVEDEDDEEKDVEAGAPVEPDDNGEDEDGEDTDDPAAVARRRDEKGKGRAEDPGEIVQLRARLSDRGTDITISIGMKQKISDIVRSIRQRIGDKRVRLMYLGKALDERTTLEDTGWTRGHVLNAMVFEGDETVLPATGKKA